MQTFSIICRQCALVALFLMTHLLAADERPNILFIFSDDHAERAISAYSGGELNQTPNIDRLADEGALFLNNSVVNSICAPSRAAVLTGTHSHINGQRKNSDTFDGSQLTFPKVLQAAGYTTSLIGKWHLRSDPEGFDYTDVMSSQGEYYNPNFRMNSGEWRQVDGYNTIVTTDLGLKWIERILSEEAGTPFFLALQYKAPHRNWLPALDQLYAYDDVVFPTPENFDDDYSGRASGIHEQEMEIFSDMLLGDDLKIYKSGLLKSEYARMSHEQRAHWDRFIYKRLADYNAARGDWMNPKQLKHWKYQMYLRDYLACVNTLDEQIGRVLNFLEEHGLADNTIVIYSSDQGFYLGEKGWFDKRWMYEESFSMPLLIRWPRRIEAGMRIDALTQNIDFGPTFVDVAEAEVPERMQGRSILPLLDGKEPQEWREAVYYHFYAENESHKVPMHEGVSTKQYKLIHYYTIGEWELFDLHKDPSETNNLYAHSEYKAVVDSMLKHLERLRSQYQVPDIPKVPVN